MLTSRQCALLTHDKLRRQLVSLERRTVRGGRESIDHLKNGHDDIANSVCGALVMAQRGGSASILAGFNRPLDLERLPKVGW